MNDDPERSRKTANYAVALITLFYAMIVHLTILEPIRGRLLQLEAASED